MPATRDKAPTDELTRIPGVGRRIAEDLHSLGYQAVDDLRDQDPELMYERRCAQLGQRIDRCLLYVFRCAVYYASTEKPDPKRLLWWSWKDGRRDR